MSKTYQFSIKTLQHPYAIEKCIEVLKEFFQGEHEIKNTLREYQCLVRLRAEHEFDVLNWHKNFSRIK